MGAIKDGRSNNSDRFHNVGRTRSQADAILEMLKDHISINMTDLRQGKYPKYYHGRDIPQPGRAANQLRTEGYPIDTFTGSNKCGEYALSPKLKDVDGLGMPTFIFCPVVNAEGAPDFIDLTCQEGFGWKKIETIEDYKKFLKERKRVMPMHKQRIKEHNMKKQKKRSA